MRSANAIPVESAYGNIPTASYISTYPSASPADEQGPTYRRYPLLYLATVANMIARGRSDPNNGIHLLPR